jgi:hypothetical protein
MQSFNVEQRRDAEAGILEQPGLDQIQLDRGVAQSRRNPLNKGECTDALGKDLLGDPVVELAVRENPCRGRRTALGPDWDGASSSVIRPRRSSTRASTVALACL